MRRFVSVLLGLVVLGLPAAASADGGCSNEGLREAQGSTFLAECRAYERVSPSDKNGGGVVTDATETQSAPSGDAVSFWSQATFGDAQGSGSIGTQYVAQRGGDGWAVHGITPPLPSPRIPTHQSSYMAFSSDLSKGVFRAVLPITSQAAPNVSEVQNLYLRNDVLAGPPGVYQLLSAAVEPVSPIPFNDFGPPYEVAFDGASADFSHILFESKQDLTADATGLETSVPKVYEWVNGVLRLAGILPNGTAAASSVAGAGSLNPSNASQDSVYNRNPISSDGSRFFFTAVIAESECPEVSAVFCGRANTQYPGTLYMRENNGTAVQLNVSERAEPDPNGPQPARFEGALPDGSVVFFATREALTNDASLFGVGSQGNNMYRYDVNAPVGDHLTLIDGGGAVLLGMSDDGSYLYLVTSLNPGTGEPFDVLHNGIVRRIGDRHGAFPRTWGAPGESEGWEFPSQLRVTPSGKDVVFTTSSRQMAQSVGYDNTNTGACVSSQCDEVYVYNYDSNKLTCISCGPGSAPPVGNSSFANVTGTTEPGTFQVVQHLSHPITDDGSRVFFSTPNALVPRDVNGKRDAYEYDTTTGEVHLISSGQAASDSYFVEVTPNGSDVFFTTHAQLVGADVDGESDLYDARVGGGFAAQNPSPAVSCSGDGCQGSPSAPPSFGAPSSLALSGSGNLSQSAGNPSVVPVKHVVKKKKKRVKHKPRRHGRGARKSAVRSTKSARGVSRRAGR